MAWLKRDRPGSHYRQQRKLILITPLSITVQTQVQVPQYYHLIMPQYSYSPLLSGSDSIRLLRLMPHKDETTDIRCELFEYSLQDGTHLYEALSYVWANPDKKLPIFMHDCSFNVTVNLHAALLRLRNHSMERIVWVDALCIDQANQKEKEHQIHSMAKIYSQANRVIVWLGEAEDNSDQALEAIRVAPGKKSTKT
jgi:hypothetical protein